MQFPEIKEGGGILIKQVSKNMKNFLKITILNLEKSTCGEAVDGKKYICYHQTSKLVYKDRGTNSLGVQVLYFATSIL